MNISSLLSPDAPRGRVPGHRTDEHHTGPELYSSTPSDVPIQAPSPIHPLNQAALWENGGYDVESVEKAMSKSSSSSSGMGGYYDPIHDQEPPPITMPVLSPGGRGLSLGSMDGAYDPVHSSGMGSSSHSHDMGHNSYHYSRETVAPLAPPPLPRSLQPVHSHAQAPHSTSRHHRRSQNDYDTYPQPVPAQSYPNVLNESSAQNRNHYSSSEWHEQEPVRESSGRHYDPVGEAVAQHPVDTMMDAPHAMRPKRVWEDDSDVGVEDEEGVASASHPSDHYQVPISTTESADEPALERDEPELEPMDEDNPSHEDSGDPPPTQEVAARIQELRILIEQYPLYKPAHLEFITLLQNKFRASETAEARSELESVRNFTSETMQLGEQAWLEWIEDEDNVCGDLEGRLKVIDLCSKAVEEQPVSVKLWKVYVDQLERQYRRGLAAGKQNGRGVEAEEEMDEGLAEIFTWDMLLGVYGQAVEATKYHIPESHVLWDRYLELLTEDLDKKYSDAQFRQTREAFLTRLKTPHFNIDTTFSAYSTFVTNFENENYEKIMVTTNKIYAASKAKFEEREMYELQLRRAIEAADGSGAEDDVSAEWYAWKSYLDWELALPKKKQDLTLICALFERSIMRYDYRGEAMWVWYLDVLTEKANRSPTLLPILERAVHAFPALPSLWSRYLVAMEARFKSSEEMEKVKNRAVDAVSKVGEEALLEVCYAWAGVSKRRILQGSVGEEEKALLMEELREYVKEFRNLDPEAKLDRLYIALCSQLEPPNIDAARKAWKGIIAHEARAISAKLWLQYYHWEFKWGTKAAAGALLRHACSKAATIDEPSVVFDTYMTYATEWGDTAELEEASWKLRRWGEKVPQAVVATAVASAATEQPAQAVTTTGASQPQVVIDIPVVTVSEAAGERTPNKRRRSVGQEEYPGSPPNKKSKPETLTTTAERTQDDSVAPKRDRENTTVIVRNLPVEIKEIRLRQFFRDCGKINSLKIVPEPEKKTATATIEFESLQDVLSAQTKDMKSIDGHAIEVQVGAGSTVYVTNFPPVADEDYISNLFKGYGEIADIRFPSLKYNTHRRFCYVQFLSADAAHAALALHGKKLGPKEKLIVKISDPNAKQERSGPVHEGREIFLRNIDFKATEGQIRELFEKEVGKVETVRLPTKVAGKHQGFGFVVFERKEDTGKAVELDDKLKIGERNLSIRLSESKRSGHGTGQARAVTPAENGELAPPPAGADGVSPGPAPSMDVIRKKTVAILNLPDTVNDTRLREVFEKYGPLRKVQLRPENGGAVVEFVEMKDAGRAELGLAGYKFGRGQEGMKLGRLDDLTRQKAIAKPTEEPKKEKGKEKEDGKSAVVASGAMFAVPRNAVGAGAARGGGGKRRGGLGFVAGGLVRRKEVVNEEGKGEGDAEAAKKVDGEAAAPKAKSNSDFKAMFMKK